MKTKDNLFIIISAILIMLFIASVVENIIILPEFNRMTPLSQERPRIDSGVRETLKGPEEAGLKSREAEYYRVIDE